MINPTNIKAVAENISELLGTPVSEKLVEQMTEKERLFVICQLTYKDGNKDAVKQCLDRAKSKVTSFNSSKVKNYTFNKLNN